MRFGNALLLFNSLILVCIDIVVGIFLSNGFAVWFDMSKNDIV